MDILQSRWIQGRAGWLMCLLVLCMASCVARTESSGGGTQDLPSLGAVRSRLPRQSRIEDSASDQQWVLARIDQFDLPLDMSMSDAWSLTEHGGISLPMLKAWQANGILIGTLHQQRAHDFSTPLRHATQAQTRYMTVTPQPTAMVTSRLLQEPIDIQLSHHDPLSPHTRLAIHRGRCQILVRLVGVDHDQAVVELVPHHHLPPTSIRTLTPQERALGGTIFEELAIQLRIARGKYLIIALDQSFRPHDAEPPITPADPSTSYQKSSSIPPVEFSSEKTEETTGKPLQVAHQPSDGSEVSAVDDELIDRVDEPATTVKALPRMISPNMGRALFAASRLGQPVHRVMVMSIEEVNPIRPDARLGHKKSGQPN